MASAPERHARRSELFALIAELAPDSDGDLADDTPLISSGLVESLGVLTLALWVEARISPAVELSAFDLAAEWDTPGAILDFLERHAPAGGHGAPHRG
jgi:hypothetical protein